MKNVILKIFIILFAILYTCKLIQAQSIELSAFLDTNVIEIGDQTYFNLQVKQPENMYIRFPEISDNLIEGIEVLSKTGIDTVTANANNVLLTQKFLITSFEDSVFVIPQFDFYIDSTAYKTDSLYLAVTLLNVDSSFIQGLDTTQVIPIFDIKGPVNTTLTFSEFWQFNKLWILSVLISLIIIASIIYFVIRYKQNRPIKLFEKPKEPAHIVAFRKLDALKEAKLWQQDKVKEYYTELTDILREYIEQRYDMQTFEKTSNEILTDIDKAKIVDADLFDKLNFILFISDLVKFAKGNPIADDNEKCFQNSVYFVEKTIPVVSQEVIIDEQNNNNINLNKNE